MNQLTNRIRFLNHSSLVVENEKIKILCDPWFTGPAFNNGWRLLHENSHEINQIDCDYIWISHEHPDHFSIPTLSQLSINKHFLYQKTTDQKVKNWLENKGHTVTELSDCEEFNIEGMKMASFVCDGYDSAALFEFPNGEKFLNLNDARADLGDTISKIKKFDLSNLKLISVQFSYANWAGNENDKDVPLHQQDLVIERIFKIYEAFKPEKLLLFASYVFCSHEENFFWNNTFFLKYVVDELTKKGINLIIPKPNQIVDLSEICDKNFTEENASAIDFWEGKAEKVVVRDHSIQNISMDEINDAYFKWFHRLWRLNKLSAILNSSNSNFSLKVKLSDKACVLEIFLFKKNIFVRDEGEFDCVISSETLIFLLKNDFGRGTVTVNSKIQFNYDFAHRFFIFFFVSYANNIGKFFLEDTLNSKLLKSISKTSVMMSILKFNKKSGSNFEEDIKLFD